MNDSYTRIAVALVAIVVSILGLSVAFAGGVAAQEAGADIIVDADGQVGNYTSIDAAVNDASDGEIIFVYNGTYTETVTVDKNVTIVGENPDTTLVKSDGNRILEVTGGDTEAVLQDLSFAPTGSLVNIIEADNIGELTLAGVSIEGNSASYGIYVTNSDSLVVENSTIDDVDGNGIHFNTVNKTKITDTVVNSSDSAGGEPGYGVFGVPNVSATVDNVTVTNNDGDGIHIGGTSTEHQVTISNSEFINNSIGVQVPGGDEFEIIGNNISSNRNAGLELGDWWQSNEDWGEPTLDVVSNEFSTQNVHIRDAPSRLNLDAISENNTFDNVVKVGGSGIYNSIQAGIDIAEDSDTVLVTPGTYNESVDIGTENVTLESTAGAGQTTINSTNGPVVQVNAPNVSVDGFTVTGAEGGNEAGQGVDVNGDSYDADGATLSNLIVRDNDDRGLVVDYSNDTTIEDVRVTDNFDEEQTGDAPEDGWETNGDADGITIWYSNSTVLRDVIAINNSDNGVYLKGDDTEVTNLTARNNGDEGLDISNDDFDGGGATVTNVTSVDNNAEAIEIEGNDAPVDISESRLADSPRGLLVRSNNADAVSITDSEFENTSTAIQNNASSTVDATENWWGHITGPGGDEPGLGSPVSDNVDVEPWLDDPFDEGGESISASEVDIDEITVEDGGSIQNAIDAAAAFDINETRVKSGTYEEQVRIKEDVNLIGEGDVTLVATSDTVEKKNQQPTLQVAANVTVRNVDVVRRITDAGVAGDGNTKAIGVNFDRSDGELNPSDIRLENLSVITEDKTGQENFGHAIWIANTNGANGTSDRYDVTATLDGVNATVDDVDPTPVNGEPDYGAAAVSVFGDGEENFGEVNDGITVTITGNSNLSDSPRGIYVGERNGDGLTNVTVTETTFSNNSDHLIDASNNVDIEAIIDEESNVFDTLVTITNGSSIYGEIPNAESAADAGDTIEVQPGIYEEEVSINTENVTLRGPNAETPGTGARDNESTIGGQIDISADNVTVRGFAIESDEFTAKPAAGIFVNGNNSLVENNIVREVRGDGSVSIHGIQVFEQDVPRLENITIANNLISDVENDNSGASGIKVQNQLRDIQVHNNTIQSVHSGGWTYGIVSTPSKKDTVQPQEVLIEYNTIEAVGNGDRYDVSTNPETAPYPGVAFGLDTEGGGFEDDPDANASEVTVTRNSFIDTPVGIQNKDRSSDLDATENWWGSANGPNATTNAYNKSDQGAEVSENVEFTPWLNASIDNEDSAAFAPVTNGSNGEFASVQAAVEASTDSAENTIHAKAGIYNETVNIGVSDIEIVGAGRDHSAINGQDGTRAVEIGSGSNDVDSIDISGFTLEADNADNFVVETSSAQTDNITIEDNDIVADGDANSGVGQVSTYLPEASDVHVVDNTFSVKGSSEAREHIAIGVNSDNVTIEENSFAGELKRDSQSSGSGGNAIEIRQSTDITAKNNEFAAVTSTDGALIFADSGISNVTISQNNLIHDSETGTGEALDVQDGADTVNATYNYWGAPTGPSGEGPGDGAAVSENVTVEPFLDAPYPDGEVTRPTTFSIETFSIDTGALPAGEQANATINVTNTGDVPGVKPIRLNATAESETRTIAEFGVEGGVALGPGQSFTQTLPLVPGSEYQGETVTFELDATDDQESEDVEVNEPDTTFNISSHEIDPASEASAGEQITVNATIENTGNTEGSQPIELVRKNGSEETVVDSTETELDSGETIDVTLTDVPSVNFEGETLSYNVSTPVDEVNVSSIEILESASFAITSQNLSSAGPVVSGDDVAVQTTIENTGDVTGNATVRLTIAGSTIAQTNVEEVGDSDTETVTLVGSTEGVSPGTRELTLQTDNDTVRQDITVEEPAEFVPTVQSVTDPVAGDGDIEVDVDVENVGDDDSESTNVTLVLPGVGNDSATTVSGGDSETLTVGTSASDAGSHALYVSTDDRTVENETTVREPAELGVDIVSATDPIVAEQDTLSVEIAVENVGDESATDTDVDLALDGDSEDSQRVTVAGGSEETVTFDGIDIGEALEGDLELTANATYDGSTVTDTETVTVLEAPDEATFRISDLNVTDDTDRGDVLRVEGGTVDVNATVENVGDLEGTQSVSVIADGIEDDETVTLGGSDSTTVDFELGPTELRTGDRQIGVETEDSDQTATVTVREPEPPTVEVAAIDTGEDLEAGDDVTATVENVGDLDATSRDISIDASVESESVGSDTESVTLAPGESTTVDVSISNTTRAGNVTATIDVDTGNETESTETTVDFGSIADALGEASQDDTVEVAPGDYEESIDIGTSGVTLSGTDATIDTDETAIEVTAEDVTIEGLAFRNASVGVNTTAAGTTVRGSRFFSSVTNGTEITAADAVMENNRFDGLGDTAIVLTGGADNATISNNNILDNQYAIYADAGIHTVDNNNIERNDVAIDADRPFADSVTEIDATDNYWGRPGGPITQGPDAEIQSPVRVEPFLTDPAEGPDYRIDDSNLDGIGEVTEGETVEVTYTIENAGGTAGSDLADTLALELDGDQVAETDAFEIGADQTAESGDELEALTFEVDAATAATLDTADLELSTGDDSSTESVDVLTAPTFEASIDDAPSEVSTDETLSVEATVENLGEADGSATVGLTFDSTTVDSDTTGSIAGDGGTETVTLSYEPSEADAGTDIPIDVTPTDGVTETVTVSVAESDEPASSGTGGGDPAPVEEPTASIPERAVVASSAEPLVDADADSEGIQVPFEGTSTVAELSFESEEISPATTVKVTEGEALPDAVTSPTGTVQSAVEIETPERIANEPATIRFELAADALDAAPEDVELQRYDESADSWTSLETSVVESDGGVVEFAAETPGFSLFAVVVPDEEPAGEPTPDAEPTEEPTPDEGPTDEPAPEPGTETDTPVDEPAQLPGFGVAVAVVALLAAALLARRRR